MATVKGSENNSPNRLAGKHRGIMCVRLATHAASRL